MPLITTANTAMFKNCSSLTCLDNIEFTTVCNRAFANCDSLDFDNLDHNYKGDLLLNHRGDVMLKCSKCSTTDSDTFTAHLGDNYSPLDMNNDGIVNGKDYAIIKRISL